MKTNSLGVALIKKFEGLHDGDLTEIGLQPKMDPVGIWTEGYGRAMRDNNGNFIKGIGNKALAYSRITIKTLEEAEQALIQDLPSFELSVDRAIIVSLTSNQNSALVAFWYNTGGSETLAKLINKHYPKDQIVKWWQNHYISSGGIVLNGLIKRRFEESQLFIRPD